MHSSFFTFVDINNLPSLKKNTKDKMSQNKQVALRYTCSGGSSMWTTSCSASGQWAVEDGFILHGGIGLSPAQIDQTYRAIVNVVCCSKQRGPKARRFTKSKLHKSIRKHAKLFKFKINQQPCIPILKSLANHLSLLKKFCNFGPAHHRGKKQKLNIRINKTDIDTERYQVIEINLNQES